MFINNTSDRGVVNPLACQVVNKVALLPLARRHGNKLTSIARSFTTATPPRSAHRLFIHRNCAHATSFDAALRHDVTLAINRVSDVKRRDVI